MLTVSQGAWDFGLTTPVRSSTEDSYSGVPRIDVDIMTLNEAIGYDILGSEEADRMRRKVPKKLSPGVLVPTQLSDERLHSLAIIDTAPDVFDGAVEAFPELIKAVALAVNKAIAERDIKQFNREKWRETFSLPRAGLGRLAVFAATEGGVALTPLPGELKLAIALIAGTAILTPAYVRHLRFEAANRSRLSIDDEATLIEDYAAETALGVARDIEAIYLAEE